MRKLILLLTIYLFPHCCTGDGDLFYEKTIVTVRSKIVALNEDLDSSGEDLNRANIGLILNEDSVNQMIVNNLIINLGSNLYACDQNTFYEYQNLITDVNVFSIYDFNDDFLANSNVSDLLSYSYYDGNTLNISNAIDTLQFSYQNFKFTEIPTYDTLQFKITGKLTDTNEYFELETDMVVLDN